MVTPALIDLAPRLAEVWETVTSGLLAPGWVPAAGLTAVAGGLVAGLRRGDVPGRGGKTIPVLHALVSVLLLCPVVLQAEVFRPGGREHALVLASLIASASFAAGAAFPWAFRRGARVPRLLVALGALLFLPLAAWVAGGAEPTQEVGIGLGGWGGLLLARAAAQLRQASPADAILLDAVAALFAILLAVTYLWLGRP